MLTDIPDDVVGDEDEPAAALPRLLEDLTEEEAYLVAILTDVSGIDTAEFAFVDEEQDDGCYRAYPFQYCFAGDTAVLTKNGSRPIGNLLGTATILTEASSGRGRWVEAEVRCFGTQPIVELVLIRDRVEKIVRTTAEHRWFAATQDKRKLRVFEEMTTRDLVPGMWLPSVHPHRSAVVVAPFGIVHGFCWGDGTRAKTGATDVVVWGEKVDALSPFLPGPGVIENRPDVGVAGRRWSLLPASFKEPVRFDEAPSYLYGWLAGYFAADGSISSKVGGYQCTLSSTSRDSLELARNVCIRLGITVGDIAAHEGRVGFGGEHVFYVLTIRGADLAEEFFLRPSHRARWLEWRSSGTGKPQHQWRVKEVRHTDSYQMVYCAVVPGTHSFVLDGYILTGNCWWRNSDEQQIEQGARSTGKSEGVKNGACVVPFNYPGQEHVITAPENKHVERLTDRIEEQILSTRLIREMVVGGKSGINHRPFFKVRWKTGARLITAIPQVSGGGIKGIHPAKLDIDEGQDFPSQGWKEVRETLKKHVKNAMWRVHGVTTGIPNDFHKMTQPEVPFSIRPYRSSMGFTVHRITAYHKPTWTEQEREDKILQYGSRNSPEYRRNVLGMHGDAANPIFVTKRLLGNSDTNEGSEYNRENYWKKEVRFEQIEDMAARQNLGPEDYGRLLIDMLDFPAEHRRYEVFWAGMDVGIARDPSEVVVFGEYVPKAAERRQDERNGIAVPLEGDTRLRLLTRFHMLRFPVPVQVEALMAIVNHYRPRAFSLDSTGSGLGLLQQLQHLAQRSRIMRIEIEPEDDDEEAQAVAKALREASKKEPAGQALTVIKGYNFGGKVVVEIDEEKAAELPAGVKPDELAEKAGIKRLVKEYATDKCRDLVDAKRLMLPYDENLLAQMNGQTWVYSSQPTDAYGNRRRTYSRGEFHCLVGDTVVTTARGPVTIDRVLVGDMVLTRAGWRPVLDAWMALPEAAVVRAVMSSGRQLVGTADHRVWTGQHGWVPLGALERGMECVAGDETATTADPVVSVAAEPGEVPVYDLTVDQDHEFFANGLVVSNCFDAIRMAVLGYSLQPIEQLLKAPPKKRAPVYDRFL